MDSDSEEEETPIVASRFAAYANRAFTFGPIVPKTPQYMIIGAVPASDASAKTEKKKMEAFTEAVSAGDKSAKALAAFSTGEVQRNFRPGALAFSWAVRHLNKESQKVVDPFNPAQMVEFKHVNPYSDSQFRYRTWGSLLAKFLKTIHRIRRPLPFELARIELKFRKLGHREIEHGKSMFSAHRVLGF